MWWRLNKPRCPSCNKPSNRCLESSSPAGGTCPGANFLLSAPLFMAGPFLSLSSEKRLNKCISCGESKNIEHSCFCNNCNFHRLPFNSLSSLHFYAGEVSAWIKRLKYNYDISLAQFFGLALSKQIEPLREHFDFLVALPSAPRNLRSRGFNHTSLVCSWVSRTCSISFLPLALEPITYRRPQVDLPTGARWPNVKSAFCCDNQNLLGSKVLLIDDVVTSGASLSSAAQCLLAAGARSVDCITIARAQNHYLQRRHVAREWVYSEGDLAA